MDWLDCPLVPAPSPEQFSVRVQNVLGLIELFEGSYVMMGFLGYEAENSLTVLQQLRENVACKVWAC